MASLKPTEPALLQKFFELRNGPGYVLDFSDSSYARFIFDAVAIDINNVKYEKYGRSKGKRLRAFWETETDLVVGKLLSELLNHWRSLLPMDAVSVDPMEKHLSQQCEAIAARLLGYSSRYQTEDDFLKQDFNNLSVKKLGLNAALSDVINQRVTEIQNGLRTKSALSVIFLCGSSLEGVLHGVAAITPKEFNMATAAPKDKDSGKPLSFERWTLNDLINVAHEIGHIGLDVKKHSHALRDFRNYIHPMEQCRSKFNPDHHTALICWQVFRAALNDLANKNTNAELSSKESVA